MNITVLIMFAKKLFGSTGDTVGSTQYRMLTYYLLDIFEKMKSGSTGSTFFQITV